MRNMDEKTKQEIWPFIIQLPSACLAPIGFVDAIIRSPSAATAGAPSALSAVYGLALFFALPAGLTALWHIKKQAGELGRLEKPTKVLAIINIIMGGMMIIFILFIVIFAIVVVFFGIRA